MATMTQEMQERVARNTKVRHWSEGKEIIDLSMPREIMLGMIEGLHGKNGQTWSDKVRMAKKAMLAAQGTDKILDRREQFKAIFTYLTKGLDHDPLLHPPNEFHLLEVEPEKGSAEAVAKKIENLRTSIAKDCAPGYVEAAISHIAIEFEYLSTLGLVDWDTGTAELYHFVTPELVEALKEAHERLYMRPFEITLQKKNMKGKIVKPFGLEVDGINIAHHVREFAADFERAEELKAAGEQMKAEMAYRSAGKALAKISYLEPLRADSKESAASHDHDDEHHEEEH